MKSRDRYLLEGALWAYGGWIAGTVLGIALGFLVRFLHRSG